MKSNIFLTLACTLILGAATLAVAEQPSTAPLNNAVIAAAVTPAQMSNADVRYEIQSQFDTNPAFSDTLLLTSVSDKSVRLDGWVTTGSQRDQAVSLAKSAAGKRDVVENVQLGGLPGGM